MYRSQENTHPQQLRQSPLNSLNRVNSRGVKDNIENGWGSDDKGKQVGIKFSQSTTNNAALEDLVFTKTSTLEVEVVEDNNYLRSSIKYFRRENERLLKTIAQKEQRITNIKDEMSDILISENQSLAIEQLSLERTLISRNKFKTTRIIQSKESGGKDRVVEREREKEKDRDAVREKERQIEGERQKQREKGRGRDRDREREREREKQKGNGSVDSGNTRYLQKLRRMKSHLDGMNFHSIEKIVERSTSRMRRT